MSAIEERTLVIVKPDAVARGLIGEIIKRFENKGLSLVGLKMLKVDQAFAEKHYEEHAGKPFMPSLLTFITAGPVVAMCLEGSSAIEVVRGLVGPTSGVKAAPGTIRGDLALSMQRNLIHASDCSESAHRELELWFDADELLPHGKGSGCASLIWQYSDVDRLQ